MNTKERKDLLGIIVNMLIENEDSDIETMETRAVEIIKKLKEHINDDIEYASKKMSILNWVIFSDSQANVRIKNKSLLNLEKAIKDVGGRSQPRGQLVFVASSMIAGAHCGAMVGMLFAFSCAYFGVITTAESVLLIMGATAIIGAIAAAIPTLELVKMFQPSDDLESSNTEPAFLNRQTVF